MVPGEKRPYVAPGEWRGDAEKLNPATSKIIEDKFKKYRFKAVVYGSILLAIIGWLVLNFTIWGNPSPGKKSMQLLNAINTRNLDDFNKLVLPEKQSSGENLYRSVTYYLGDNGVYSDISFDVDQEDAYAARVYVKSGEANGMFIDRSDNLTIILENHKGIWYVNPQGTVLIP